MEPTPFDSASFDCLTHNILQDLMCLTFLADEKQLSLNPLSLRSPRPATAADPADPPIASSEKSELERRLDADIARVLGQEDCEDREEGGGAMPRHEETLDHNADKKSTRAPIARHEDDPGEDTWWPNRPLVSAAPDDATAATAAALLLENVAPPAGSIKPPTSLTGSISKEAPEEKEDKDSEGTSTISTPDTVEDRSQRDFDEKLKKDKLKTKMTFSDLDLIEVAHLQVGALKALMVLMTSSRHIDLLLVPK